MKKMVVEECSLKQLFFFRILEMLDHEKREWKVDVNIGFWKCWAIFRADILKFSKRNDMSVFDGSLQAIVHFEFWWSFSTLRRLSLIEKLKGKIFFQLFSHWEILASLRNRFCCQMCQLSPALIFWQNFYWKATQNFQTFILPISNFTMFENFSKCRIRKFWILAFSTNFWPFKVDLSGNTVWPQSPVFQKIARIDHIYLVFLINFYQLKIRT